MVFHTECVCLWFGTQTMKVAFKGSLAFTKAIDFSSIVRLSYICSFTGCHLLNGSCLPVYNPCCLEKTLNKIVNYCYLSLPAKRRFPVIFHFCEPIYSFQRTLGTMCFVLNLVLNNTSNFLYQCQGGLLRPLKHRQLDSPGVAKMKDLI